ncbi:MAG: hypothetical protein V1660_04930 [archaeon]
MNNIIKSCLNKGILIDQKAVEILEVVSGDEEISQAVIETCCSLMKDKILNENLFSENKEKIILILNNLKQKFPSRKEMIDLLSQKILEKFKTSRKEDQQETAKNTSILKEESVKVLASYSIPGKKLEVEDFVRYFRNRFNIIKGILQEHSELQNLTSIGKINGQKQNISIIGIISDKRVTKNKNVLIEVEDLTGRISLLVNANKPEIFQKCKDLVFDDIAGFKCSGNNEILFVNDIVFPDAMIPERRKSLKEEYAAFTSDIHVGSTRFLEANFAKFIKWLNGEIGSESQRELAKKVKYLFIVGDTVDGIGIYPNQENFLSIKDIKRQYELLASYLSKIRKDVKIIMSPGQHDSVRVAEPQPPIDKHFAEPLHNIENLILVSNPALINIGSTASFSGLKVLMYHGASFHSLISDIEELRLTNAHHCPSKVVKHVLKRRHLSPTHSSVVYIPTEISDPLAILIIPDIITTGEMHKTDVSSYNNILTIACSCWQSITPYEEKVGNEPDPCKVPILNMKTGQVNILDFTE